MLLQLFSKFLVGLGLFLHVLGVGWVVPVWEVFSYPGIV